MKPNFVVDVYETKGSKCITVIPRGSKKDADCEKLIREIHGLDWDDCMRQHHELMGWEPYNPF